MSERFRTCILCGKPSFGKTCRDCFEKKVNKGQYSLSNKHSPVIKKCANPNCNETFYANGSQRFCSGLCKYFVDKKRMNVASKKWKLQNKGIGINILKKFGKFMENLNLELK